MLEFVTYSNLFAYTLVLIGMAALFLGAKKQKPPFVKIDGFFHMLGATAIHKAVCPFVLLYPRPH